MIQKNKLQIALEFLIIYSFVLVIFLIIFVVIANQKSSLINIESYSSLQLIAQNIANYMNYAQIAGTGFSIAIPLVGNINNIPYTVSISSTGVVYANMTIGNQKITAIALSNVHNLIINGTLTASSNSNTINLYSIPVYTGKLYIANSHGSIYINQQPPVTLDLPSYININSNFNNISYTLNFKGGLYNGNNGYAKSASAPIIASQISICAWINAVNDTVGAFIGGQYESFMIGQQSNGYLLIHTSTNNKTSGENNYIGGNVYLNTWNMLCGIYNGTYYKGYVNGQQVFNDKGPQFYTNLGNIWVGGNSFGGYLKGSVVNVQIYNTSLSPYQVSQLYDQGISGIPVSSNIAAWYPLQGNANDYSGNGYNLVLYGGVYNGVNYIPTFNKTPLYFLNALIMNRTGVLVSNALVGYVSSFGNMSIHGPYASLIGGSQSSYVSYNGSKSGYVQSTMFNGNSSTIKNLKLWYPLDYEYSMNATYDLSGNNNTGIASNVLFNGTISNQSSFMQGIFNGNSFVKSSQQLNINSNELTISAWVDLKQNNTQNIASVFNSSNSLQIMIINGKAGIALNNKKLSGSSVSDNSLYFITGVWNGYNNTISIYVNGLLNNITSANSIYGMNINAFSIGNSTSAANSLDGIISNVQIYNQSLTQQQIIQLYLQGPASIPAANHVIAWLPLDGNSNDYSQNNYKTVAQNINFINLQQSTDFYKTHIPPFSVIAWGVNDTVPSSDLSYEGGWGFIPYAWVAANPTHPTNITVIQKGYFPITIFNDTSFGWTYRTTPYWFLLYVSKYPPFPNNVSDNLNFLNNGYVKPGDPLGINASLGVYNDTYFSAVGYIYLNGKYNIKMQSDNGQEIFWKNILNNKWQNLSNGTEWGPAEYIETEKPILFNPGIYEFAVNWVNLAGGGFSDFFIAKKSNNSITNYASFNGKSSIILNKNKALLNNQLNFSIFAWIYLNSYSATQDIYDEGNPINLTFRLNAGMLQISDSNSNNNPIWKNFISTNKIPLHQWTFVGAVLNSSNTGNYFILYQNLNKTIFTGGQDESAPGAHEFGIGGNPGNITNGPQNLNPFNGSIADLQIYNRSLSSYQISQLYDQGIPKTITTNIST